MFSLNDSMRYWLYNRPTDMRKSYYTLSGIVTNELGCDPCNGDVYIFMNKSRNRIKLLHWEPGGLVLYCACAMHRQPACMLFSQPIDSLAGAGAVLADVWLEDVSMPVIDSLGDEFLDYVKDGMKITVTPEGTVTVE